MTDDERRARAQRVWAAMGGRALPVPECLVDLYNDFADTSPEHARALGVDPGPSAPAAPPPGREAPLTRAAAAERCGVGVCDFTHYYALPGWQLLLCVRECKPFVGRRGWWARRHCGAYPAACAAGE